MSGFRTEGEASDAWSCPLYWVDVWGARGGGRGTEGVDGPSNMQMKARSYTSVCLSTLARAEGMPTHQLAYTPARRGERSLGGRGERGQSTSAFMFFYALSQRAFTGFCPCLREVFVCSLENFTLLSDGAVWRGCLVYKVWSEMCMQLALIFFFFPLPNTPPARHAL